MLRIFTFEHPLVLKLRIEGDLNADNSAELARAVDSAFANGSGRRVILDAADLEIDGPIPADALRLLALRGIEFASLSPQLERLLIEDAEQACDSTCTNIQRLLFHTVEYIRGRRRKHLTLCHLIRALLPAELQMRYMGSALSCK